MNPAQSSISLLAIVISVLSIWWVSRTLKEGKKAVEEMKIRKVK